MLRSVKLVREGSSITSLGWDEHNQLVRVSAFEVRNSGDIQWLAKELAGSTPKDVEVILPPGFRLPFHAVTAGGKFRWIIEYLFARELRPRPADDAIDLHRSLVGSGPSDFDGRDEGRRNANGTSLGVEK